MNPELLIPNPKKLHKICLLILIIGFPFISFAQNPPAHLDAEKVYLQLDNEVYTSDQTIWFKAIVTDAVDHKPTKLSGILYTELFGPEEQLLESKLIKIKKGIGKGDFQLFDYYPEGVYLIRAYTEWNLNFGHDFIFEKYIRVFSTKSNETGNCFQNISLIKKDGDNLLSAIINPYSADSLHQGRLGLKVFTDNLEDSVVLKKGKDNLYRIEYAYPDSTQLITLQLETDNLFTQSKTIALKDDLIDLQFFPESGELVNGLNSKVGFKAIDVRGKGIAVSGKIYNEKNKVVTDFKSNELGMGNFRISKADTSQRYYALISSPENASPKKVNLPKVRMFGNTLSVTKSGEKYQLLATSNYMKNHPVSIQVKSRGKILFDIQGRLKDGQLSYSIPASVLPEGIIAFVLFDDIKQPVAERLVFNARPDSRIQLELQTNMPIYKKRESTTLTINLKDSLGKNINTDLSILVVNKEQTGTVLKNRQNILSYFLMSSELKGEIEDPGNYFDEKNPHPDQLDNLMLSQGWSLYKYAKPTDVLQYQPEYGLTVSGTVTSVLSEKRIKENAVLTLMPFGEKQKILVQQTDSLGRFYFDLEDEYGESANIVLQTANQSGKKMNYGVALDYHESPNLNFDHRKSIEKADSSVTLLVKKNLERKQADDAFRLSDGVTMLDEVVVEDMEIIPEREEVTRKYGKPALVISGEELRENEPEWSSGLFSLIKAKYREAVEIKRMNLSRLCPNGYFSWAVVKNRMTLVMVDGVIVPLCDCPLVQHIPTEEVRSFEIIEFAKDFSSLYNEFYPNHRYGMRYSMFKVYDAFIPLQGHVIAIYTYGGNGHTYTQKSPGILKTSFPVFSADREFYSPKYQQLSKEDWIKPDLRALVHWEPSLKSNGQGDAKLTFYNADIRGEMLVIVEAINEYGEIAYQELVYEVE